LQARKLERLVTEQSCTTKTVKLQWKTGITKKKKKKKKKIWREKHGGNNDPIREA